MSTENLQALPAPPSLMKAVMAGFDAITQHIGLIFFSIFLDFFLWFGPRLRLFNLIQSFFKKVMLFPEIQSSSMGETIQISREFWLMFAERFNLLSFLRTLPVGIPSLMFSRAPIETPYTAPLILEIPTFEMALIASLIIILFGLLLGTLFFSIVSQAAVSGEVVWRDAFRSWPRATLQILLLSLLGFFLLLATVIPFSCFSSVLFLSGLGFERFAFVFLLLIGGMLLWWLLPLLFAPHGIFLNGRTMWSSVRDSVKLTRMTLPRTGLLFLIFILLSEGLDMLWKVPPETSWLSAVGIIGHSFVTTSLIAGSFIYYRDAEKWLQSIQS